MRNIVIKYHQEDSAKHITFKKKKTYYDLPAAKNVTPLKKKKQSTSNLKTL